MRKLVCLTACLPLLVGAARAAEPYWGYQYDSWGVAEPAPNVYEVRTVFDGKTAGTESFANPQDMVFRNGKLYILDSGNARVAVLDEAFRFERQIKIFRDARGNEERLSEPQGLFVTDAGDLIIADTGNRRILVCDLQGNVRRILERPDSEIFPDDLEFMPVRVLGDRKGFVYVLSKDFFYGAVLYDETGEFAGFFGPNTVEFSFQVAFDRFWDRFRTAKQKEYTARYVPVNFTSFDIDAADFVYTCSRPESSLNEIKKLNTLGRDILKTEVTIDALNRNDYGEKEKYWYNGSRVDTVFVDIDVSDTGLINALDFTYGRVYQYDGESNFIAAFGGLGDQRGLFKIPAAVETVGSDVLVLDSEKGTVTVFTPTEYGRIIHRAVERYNEGYYEEALRQWEEVLKYNGNTELAYRGIGRAHLERENYAEALKYLKAGQDRQAYSKAFGYYRSQVIRENFVAAAAVGIAFLALFFLWGPLRRRLRALRPAEAGPRKTVNPFYVLRRPSDGLTEMRSRTGFPQAFWSAGLLCVWFLASIIERQGTGFVFNVNRPENLSLALTAAKTFGVFLLFTISSWVVGSLNRGEAKFSQLFNLCACALLPLILASLARSLLTNFMVYEEGALLNWLVLLAGCYAFVLLLLGVMTAQQYAFSKTLVSLLLTAAVMAVILFVLVLLFSLIQQVLIFVLTIYNEIMFRIT